MACLFSVYGEYLVDLFDVSPTTLGQLTLTVGVAELASEGICWYVSDKVGLLKAQLVATVSNTVSYAALALLATFVIDKDQEQLGVGLFCVLLFAIFISFETALVICISRAGFVMEGEEARSIFMGAFVAFMTLGFALGSWLGAQLYDAGGMEFVAWLGIGILIFPIIITFVDFRAEGENAAAGSRQEDEHVSDEIYRNEKEERMTTEEENEIEDEEAIGVKTAV